MKTIHNPALRADLVRRLDTLRPDSTKRWGKMTVEQMLHHLNAGLELSLGRLSARPKRVPVPKPLFKLIALNLPWPKGKVETARELRADGTYDFLAEQSRLKRLIGEVAEKPLPGIWTEHPAFGPMTGRDCSRLQYRHIDYHLKQFGA